MLPTIDYNRDVINATLEHWLERQPPLSFAYQTYQFFNTGFAKNVKKIGGRKLKSAITTGTVGNAGFTNVWAEDSVVIKNITKTYELDNIKHCQGAMAFNKVEMDANKTAEAAEQIFDVVELQYNKAMAEVIDKLYLASWTGLAAATDVDSIYGIPTWLSMGTVSSTGGYTGYRARYNDASNTGDAAGTAFDKAGLTSSATEQPEYANYFIDHLGVLDESLYLSINKANLVLHFQPPIMIQGHNVPVVSYVAYTNQNMILTLNALNAKLNANVGPQPNSAGYFPTTGPILPGGIPVVYVDILDTRRDSVYGADPIFGVNHNVLYPVVLNGWDFKITEGDATNRHLVTDRFIDWVGQWWCARSPRYAGYLICDRPAS